MSVHFHSAQSFIHSEHGIVLIYQIAILFLHAAFQLHSSAKRLQPHPTASKNINGHHLIISVSLHRTARVNVV
jgi:hypothetical protein